jgi:hypothetical protein
LLLIETSFSGSSPAQGHADVTRHTVGIINDLYFQLVAARPNEQIMEALRSLEAEGRICSKLCPDGKVRFFVADAAGLKRVPASDKLN